MPTCPWSNRPEQNTRGYGRRLVRRTLPKVARDATEGQTALAAAASVRHPMCTAAAFVRAPDLCCRVSSFAPGDRVHVAGLGSGVVREVRSGGRYIVEIKGRTLSVQGRDLERAAPERAARADTASCRSTPETGPSSIGGAVRLDLHGHTAAEAIGALDQCLNDAILAGRHEVHVIHGRSGGILKSAVQRRLAQLPSVRGFHLDPRNPGVTIVTL